ncbi:N-acetyl-gamma-glutamyl-phosphate reductase [Bacillus marinisedimentorum]|uniref:N-acetyl-gamma-glutamyl-phosphate reductase n=1 Tax=Bacillus marinisedimentorum TaxID=1821260 RepID=UPI0008729554|nr:N-acetyl-gamma-glutamyl-phosphate reductase [Bacillus marinisedimentorum]
MKAAIIGATGYGGAELIRLLNDHDHVSNITVYSSSKAGESLSGLFPHLAGSGMNPVLQKIEPQKIEADVVFLATPSGVSAKLTPQLIQEGLTVIDLSGDFRIKNSADYEKWYNKPAPDSAFLDEAVYGLTEWEKENVRSANLIANPGCYPTAVLLALGPLLKNGLIDPRRIIVDAKSGVSGAGRGTSLTAHFGEMSENFKAYKVNRHQHIPEIEQQLSKWDGSTGPISFTTHLVPMVRGILSTIYVELNKGLTEKDVSGIYMDEYAGEPFVRIRDPEDVPATKEVRGSNFCDIGFSVDPRTGRTTIVSAIDNLVKGAAGQAVHNMNVRFGFDEKTGLKQVPVYP